MQAFYCIKKFFGLFLDHLLGDVLTFGLSIDIISQGENVRGNSLSLPYFVILISFTRCAKKLFTVIRSSSISEELFDFFLILIGKQICMLDLHSSFLSIEFENLIVI